MVHYGIARQFGLRQPRWYTTRPGRGFRGAELKGTLRPMFIRWQHINAERWPRWSGEPVRWVRHKAILVESVRVEGKPRQKHVAFVASYVQGETPQEIEYQRITFWRDARQRLDQLGNRITAQDRSKVEAALGKRVPPTTAAEEVAYDRERKASVKRMVDGIIAIHER